MTCKNCGAYNADDAKFCMVCGTPLNENKNQEYKNGSADYEKYASSGTGNRHFRQTGNAYTPYQEKGHENTFRQQDDTANASSWQNGQTINLSRQAQAVNCGQDAMETRNHKKLGMIIVGAAAVLVLLVVFLIIRINARPTINLNKYLTIETTGYNGYGKVSVMIDWNAIEAKYGKKLHLKGKSAKGKGNTASGETAFSRIRDNVYINCDKYDHLSNGDKIAYTWEVKDSIFDDVKVNLKYKNGECKVSKLEELETFDAFADVIVTFEGFAPDGTASFTYNGNVLNSGDFSCDKTTGLSNGDVIKITWDDSNIESLAMSLGKVPASAEKEYTVSGLDEYVGTYADLSEDFIKTLRSESEDTIYAYTAGHYDSTSALSDLSYAGYMVRLVKDPDDYYNFFGKADSFNDVYIIYSGTVKSSEGYFRPTRVYYPVRFKNVIKSGDQFSYTDNLGIEGYSYIDGSWSSTNGYTNPVICYTEIIEAYRDVYKTECGDGFEKYEAAEELTKAADISEDYKNILYADAKDIIETYAAKEYQNGTVLGELSLLGEYFLLAKTQSSDYVQNNRYIVVYSATVTNTEGKFEPTVVYFPVEYDGLVKLTDDEYMVTATKGLQGYKMSFPGSFIGTQGYFDGQVMFSELITANRDNYTYEMTENLKQFGE